MEITSISTTGNAIDASAAALPFFFFLKSKHFIKA
jgi:hypothetical protein